MTTLTELLVTASASRGIAAPAAHLRDAIRSRLKRGGWVPRAAGLRGPASARECDEDLLRRFLAGSEEAFEQLFSRHTPQLLGFALRQLPHDRASAEDLVQEAFAALLTSATSLLEQAPGAPPPNLRAYLFRVLRNKIADHQKQRLRQTPTDPLPDEPDTNAERSLLQVLAQHDLSQLAELVFEHCTILEQHALALLVRDPKPAELAAALQLIPGHARKLKHATLAKLRAALRASQPGVAS